MIIFQVKRAAQKEAVSSPLFTLLEYWAKSHDIPVTVLPQEKGREDWGFSFSNSGLMDNRIAMSGKNSVILFHECAHRFLTDRPGYVSSHYLNIKGIRADAGRLKKAMGKESAASKDAKPDTGKSAYQIDTTRLFYTMDSLALAEADSHKKAYPEHTRLNTQLISIFKAEAAISQAARKKLEKALGKPQQYKERTVPLYRAGEVIGSKKSPGYSTIGNITDESSVFHYPTDISGHPMENYHEFFASLSTSIALGGSYTISCLDAFAALAKAEPEIRPLFSQYKALLSGSLLSLKWFYLDIAAIPNAKKLPEIENFRKNIWLLEAWLKAN